MTSTSLTIFDNGDIRVTEDKRYSAIDIIRVIGGKRNPQETWRRLKKQYVKLSHCDSFKFSGRGQQTTPVVDKQQAVELIGLLPSAVGQSYREESAKLFLEYVENPAKLAERALDRAERLGDDEGVKRIAVRAKGKVTRNEFTSLLAQQGVKGNGFGYVTNEGYRGYFGGQDANDLKRLFNTDDVRGSLPLEDDVAVTFYETLSQKRIKQSNAKGNYGCAGVVRRTAEDVRQLVNS